MFLGTLIGISFYVDSYVIFFPTVCHFAHAGLYFYAEGFTSKPVSLVIQLYLLTKDYVRVGSG